VNNATEARRLLRAHRYGALCTQSKKLAGYPFGSIAPYLLDHDGSLIIHISALAEHTKNIANDPRVSLITHNQNNPDIQMQGRVTVVGNAQKAGHQPRYLRYFPQAIHLATLDFSFYRILPVAIRYIGGVGRVHWINMETYAVTLADAFAEEAFLDEINEQHVARDLLRKHYGVDAQDAAVIGLDCDGIDIHGFDRVFRLDFTRTLTEPKQFKQLSSLDYHLPD
jgi:hypothetical protein